MKHLLSFPARTGIVQYSKAFWVNQLRAGSAGYPLRGSPSKTIPPTSVLAPQRANSVSLIHFAGTFRDQSFSSYCHRRAPGSVLSKERKCLCALAEVGLLKVGNSLRLVARTYSSSGGGLRAAGEDKERGERLSERMAEGGRHQESDGEIKYPAVDTYGPFTIKGSDLEPGKKKKWCTCGLSKKAPWCDGAHKKTGFKPLKWEVPEKPQSIYQICNCKYTKSPPFCDGTHTNLPEIVLERQKNCPNKPNHEECVKLCTGCGWKVDF